MTETLRRLARSHKYQFLFSRAKDIGSIQLFQNTSDFTDIQIHFLQWLTIYDSLYQDLHRKEEFMSQEVIDDDLRTDAYLLYKSIQAKKPKAKKESKIQKDINSTVPSIIFKKGR